MTNPSSERFETPFSIRGRVLSIRRYLSKKQYLSRGRRIERMWRMWVTIETVEGWTLAGVIGNAWKEFELPAIVVGDLIEVNDLRLSRLQGGTRKRVGRYRPWAPVEYCSQETQEEQPYISCMPSARLRGRVIRSEISQSSHISS